MTSTLPSKSIFDHSVSQRPRRKLAVRHLPPTWTKEDFFALLSPYDTSIEYREFSPGKPGSNPNPLLSIHSEKPAKPSCGYVAFKDPKTLIEFAKRVHGMKVLDGMGMEHEVEVMVAIHQGYTTEPDPLDPLSGTIKDNTVYQEWLKSRETKKAEPVTVEAMQNLPKEIRTSALVEELRKRMEKGNGKGVVGSELNGGKKKKNKKRKGKGKESISPPTIVEQPRTQVVGEHKPPVFKIISRQSSMDSKPKDTQSTNTGLSVKESPPQEHTTSDHPANQGKVHVFTTTHTLQTAPKKYRTSDHQQITTRITLTDASKYKNDKNSSSMSDGHTLSIETVITEGMLDNKINSPNETSKKHVAIEETTDAGTLAEHSRFALNPSSNPFLPTSTVQMGLTKSDKSGSKKFTTLSSRTPSLSPTSHTLAFMTEGSSQVQIRDKDHEGQSQDIVVSLSQLGIAESVQSVSNILDNGRDDQFSEIVMNELSQEQTKSQDDLAREQGQETTPSVPQTSETTEHGNQEPLCTNKAVDKPKKKFQIKARILESTNNTNSNEKDNRTTPTSKSSTHKDKQLTTRYFDSDTINPSAGTKGTKEKEKEKGKGSSKDTSHGGKDKTPTWFIDIPQVKEQQGGNVNIASFNLPSLRESHPKSTTSKEVKDEYQEVVVVVPIKSEFIPTTQYDLESEITSPLPKAGDSQNIEGKTVPGKKKKRNKKKKSTDKDSIPILGNDKAQLEQSEWQKKYDALMAIKPNKSDAPPS